MEISYGSSRSAPIGLRHLENFKPDKRKAELYNRISLYTTKISGRTRDIIMRRDQELLVWATDKGYSQEEVNKMKIAIRR